MKIYLELVKEFICEINFLLAVGEFDTNIFPFFQEKMRN